MASQNLAVPLDNFGQHKSIQYQKLLELQGVPVTLNRVSSKKMRKTLWIPSEQFKTLNTQGMFLR
jgi:hypothetical protein